MKTSIIISLQARAVEELGAVGIIVMDNVADTSVEDNELFSLSVDNNPKPIHIPTVFAYYKEGMALLALLKNEGKLFVRLAGEQHSSKQGFRVSKCTVD